MNGPSEVAEAKAISAASSSSMTTRGISHHSFCAHRKESSSPAIPSLLKIDVESFELEVLEGAKGTLAGCQPIVLVEIARREDEVLALMTSFGYGLFSDDLKRFGTVSPGRNYVFLHEGVHEALIDRVCRG